MSIRLAVSYAAAGALVVGLAAVSTGKAKAQANVLRECGTQYQAAKAANELKGQSWQDFLKACRARLAEQPAPAETPAAAAPPAAPTVAAPAPAPAAPAPEPAPVAASPAPAPAAVAPSASPPAAATPPAAAKPAAKPASDSKAAQQARQKTCGAEWKAKKAELQKADPKLKWPQYWSECNKRLKAAAE